MREVVFSASIIIKVTFESDTFCYTDSGLARNLLLWKA